MPIKPQPIQCIETLTIQQKRTTIQHTKQYHKMERGRQYQNKAKKFRNNKINLTVPVCCQSWVQQTVRLLPLHCQHRNFSCPVIHGREVAQRRNLGKEKVFREENVGMNQGLNLSFIRPFEMLSFQFSKQSNQLKG